MASIKAERGSGPELRATGSLDGVDVERVDFSTGLADGSGGGGGGGGGTLLGGGDLVVTSNSTSKTQTFLIFNSSRYLNG